MDLRDEQHEDSHVVPVRSRQAALPLLSGSQWCCLGLGVVLDGIAHPWNAALGVEGAHSRARFSCTFEAMIMLSALRRRAASPPPWDDEHALIPLGSAPTGTVGALESGGSVQLFKR